jgi:hypothetical protein
MADILEEMENRLKHAMLEKEEIEREVERITQLRKMPFHLRIQEPEMIEQLKGYESRSKEVFFNHSAKKWRIPENEVAELFTEYFTEFLKGQTENIAQFLTKRGYTQANEQ